MFLRIDPFILQTDVPRQDLLTNAGFTLLPRQWLPIFSDIQRAVMILNVGRSEPEILAGMRSSHRYYIRHAADKGLEFESGTNEHQLLALYGLLATTAAAKGLVPPSLSRLRQLVETVLDHGLGTIFVARHSRQPVAALLVAGFGTTAHLLYAGSDWSRRSLYANEPLEWLAIEWAMGNGCVEYDMGGIGTLELPKEGHPFFGIYNFKLGFGAKLHQLTGYFDLVNHPVAYCLHRHLETSGKSAAYRAFRKMRSLGAAAAIVDLMKAETTTVPGRPRL
jgi:lipid II:glycine glycyltransferase (peptidoglycan interpeptide bridge formation enzyme)